ncbi:unnamed protein product [Clonostachys byssicola]|uniref:Leptomycin B resistance protein pmd1 n=1 Tax=Clonostachys byssicola TaxID=160290 RepID=A0A9N9UKN2_9HYPO|nr:unnamed protein product [Clonostachys byssicola]
MAAIKMDTLVASEATAPHKIEEDAKAHPQNNKRSSFNDYVRVFSYGQGFDYVLLSVGIIAAIGSGVALAMVNLVIGDFITIMTEFSASSGPSSNFMSKVSKAALYFIYIAIARFVCTYVYSSLLTYVALRITRNLRYRYLKSALGQEVGFFDVGTGGSISMQVTSNAKLIQSGISEKLGQVFQAASTLVASFIIAFISQWKLTLILSSIVPALLLVAGFSGALDAGIETKILKTYARAGSLAETALASIRTIKAFELVPRMTHEYSKILGEARTLGNKKNVLYAIMFAGEYFVIFAGMALAFWQGIRMMVRGEITEMGTTFTVLFAVIMAAAVINSLAPHLVTFGRAGTAAGELFELIDRSSSINPFDHSGKVPQNTQGIIELRNLTFSYPTRPDIRVLDNFSLDVPAGKVTALVGPSGSGKSTIIGLLERWYNPSAGSIMLDGQEIKDLNLKWLRTYVRLVQQEPVLFNGTVFDNIANGLIGTPWEDSSLDDKMQRVHAAAKTAFAHDFIQELVNGYDTRIGERGGLLSGGQKQRIAIARSIISEPRILLLDEATSALDPYAEAVVQKALDEASKNRTTIVIAHKLKTVRNADNIVVMGKGKIVEQGRHEDLVARHGVYASLVRAQDLSAPENDQDSSDDFDVTDEDIVLKPTNTLQQEQSQIDRKAALSKQCDYSLYEGTGIVRTIWRLVRFTPEIKSWYILVALTCIIGAGVYPGQTVLIGQVMDLFKAEDMQNRANFLALMFFVMALGLLVIYGVLGWATNVLAQTLAEKVRKDMFSSFIRQDLSFFDRPENTVGALTSKIDSFAQSIFELMGFTIAIVLMALVSVFVCAIMSIAFSWKLGLVGVCAGFPPMILSGYARIRLETKMDAEIDSRFSNSASIASETVTAIRTVSSLAIEDDVLRRYTDELDHAIRGSKASLFTIMIWFSLTQSIEYCILALGFWYGSKLVAGGDITFYQFFVSFMAVYFSGQGAGQLFSFASSFTKANSAANYFFWIKSLQPSILGTAENEKRGPSDGCKSYHLDNLEFSYPLAPRHRVLKGVSLKKFAKITPGQFVAFVGASGCGKSTMISLLERFYDPTSGAIVIDSTHPLRDLNPRLYRAHVALVQQEPTLFPGSIRDNIAMGVDSDAMSEIGKPVDDKAIEVACRAANAWDFVSSLSDGLGTLCGTGGSQLSGGQRQRIAIARALVRNPSVILLDEATSALDTESERVVQAALMEVASSNSRITIAVAHRLSTVKDADCIFVFHNGRIAELGTHSSLIAEGGMYKKMCESQSLDS